MPSLSFAITADAVAWYGAIVATASAFIAAGSVVLNVVEIARDRAVIKVKAREGFLFPTIVAGAGTKIIVEAINVGRRSVTLNSCGLKMKNGKYLLIPNPSNISFPYELKEGKSVSILFDKAETIKTLKTDRSRVVSALFTDATGKRYSKHYHLRAE